MSKRLWVSVVIVIVGLGVAVRMTAPAQAPKPAEVPFKGKVVVFAPNRHEAATVALQGPSIRRLGEVDFLTGEVVGSSAEGDWRVGTVLWVPLAEIREMVEFKDLREAKRVRSLRP